MHIGNIHLFKGIMGEADFQGATYLNASIS